MALGLAALAAPTLQGAAAGATAPAPDLTTQTSDTRQVFNIIPSGINIGEITKPYNEGSLVNGGYGFVFDSRYTSGVNPDLQRVSLDSNQARLPIIPILIIGGAIGLIFFLRR